MSGRSESDSKKPRMLVTGSAGMTGYHVSDVFFDYALEPTDKTSLDVRDISQVRAVFRRFAPDIVLNLAAETDVDLCEQDQEHAFQTNTVGAQNVAVACNEIGALLVHFGTSSVFPGRVDQIYTEFDSARPINTHGRSKWKSEQLIPKFTRRFLIVRPGWMFGGFRRDKKFVGVLRKQILEEGAQVIRGVVDRKGSSTYALDCLKLTRRLIESGLLGTFHVVNTGFCTRFEMAQVIAQHYGIRAEPASSEEFRSPAPRPASQMVRNCMLELYGLSKYMRDWKSALEEYLSKWDELESKV